MIAAQELTEADKLKTVELRGVRWLLMDKYPQYKVSVVGQTKRLVHFLSLRAKTELVLEQRVRGTS